MEKLRYIREPVLIELEEKVPENLSRYRQAENFKEFLGDDSLTRELDLEFNPKLLQMLRKPVSKNELFDIENCLIILDALPNLTPFDARDARLWVFLCHAYCLSYARARWPIDDDDEKAVKHIRTHFFVRGDPRSFERNHALARLWWMAHLCTRVPSLSLEEALEVLLYRTDVRAQIIERPTLMQNPFVFSAVIEKLRDSFEGDKQLFERGINHKFMQKLNILGGFKLLDVLSFEQIREIVNQVHEETMSEVSGMF